MRLASVLENSLNSMTGDFCETLPYLLNLLCVYASSENFQWKRPTIEEDQLINY